MVEIIDFSAVLTRCSCGEAERNFLCSESTMALLGFGNEEVGR